MPDPFLADFVALNRRLGGDPLLSQGSGGNTSVKIDPGTLRVKATGVPLREVSENRGWVDMDLKALRAGVEKLWLLKGEEQQQRAYRALLSGAQKTPEPRVSIETNLHVLLADRWVAHVHSLGGQLLGLLPEAEARRLAAEALGSGVELRLAPPATPGYELGRAVADQLKASPPSAAGESVSLWILQNHGLAWGAATVQSIFSASDRLEVFVRRLFKLDRFPPAVSRPATAAEAPGPAPAGKRWARLEFPWPRCRFDARPFFPDFAGHFHGDPGANLVVRDERIAYFLTGEEDRRGREEVLFAQALISTVAHENGCHRPLASEAVRLIQEFVLEKPAAGGPKAY